MNVTRRSLIVRAAAVVAAQQRPAFARNDTARSSSAGSAAQSVHAEASALDAHLRQLERNLDFSGAVLLAQGDRVVLRKAYGAADRSSSLPNRVDTQFNLASLGKLFTSLAIMRLAAGGTLSLDDSLGSHLPWYPNRAIAARITIAQLLGHTAGLGNYAAPMAARAKEAFLELEDYVRLFVDEPLVREPGSGFLYSNTGYILLGLVIEQLSRERYTDHIRRTVFEPLGMKRSDFGRADIARSNRAVGYTRALEQPGEWLSNIYQGPPGGAAAGGGYSTIDDLHRFARALQQGRLLAPAIAQQWLQPRQPYHRGSYGYGTSTETVNGYRIIGHSGGHPGVATELMWFPELDRCLILLSNSDFDAYFDLEARVKRDWLGGDAGSRNYEFTVALIEAIRLGGAAAGEALIAARAQGIEPREGVVDAAALRYLHRRETDAALALLRFNTRTFPDSSWPLWSLAEALRVAGRGDEAVAAYTRYLERETEDADAKRWVERLNRRTS